MSSGSSSFFWLLNQNTVIYTDVADEDTAIAQWGKYWNCRGSNLYSEVVYGATYEEYQNVPVTTALNVDTEDEDMPEDVE